MNGVAFCLYNIQMNQLLFLKVYQSETLLNHFAINLSLNVKCSKTSIDNCRKGKSLVITRKTDDHAITETF